MATDDLRPERDCIIYIRQHTGHAINWAVPQRPIHCDPVELAAILTDVAAIALIATLPNPQLPPMPGSRTATQKGPGAPTGGSPALRVWLRWTSIDAPRGLFNVQERQACLWWRRVSMRPPIDYQKGSLH
jgi:hypothetical protein